MDDSDIVRLFAYDDGKRNRPDWEERVLKRSTEEHRAKVAAKRPSGSVCRHNKRGGLMGFSDAYVEFFDADGTSVTRAVQAKICDRCGTWRNLGQAADASVAADIDAARLIQTIERTDRVAKAMALLDLVLNLDHLTMTTGQMCGWNARDLYYGTDPWDAGWLAAAYFNYDPCNGASE